MKVILIRHAQTAGNLDSRYVGNSDEPLAPEGVATARRRGADASVTVVHTSALLRTRQTAGILYPNATVIPHSELNEMRFGRFEGKRWRDLENDPEYMEWVASRCELPCPDGESKAEFTDRCRAAFRSIIADGIAHGAGELRFVLHGGVIMAVLSGFVVPARDYFSWRTDNCGGHVIESADGDPYSFALVETFSGPDGDGRTGAPTSSERRRRFRGSFGGLGAESSDGGAS